ncbi:MAG TPA: metallophosphoesterase [Thermoanaerobaculia bacterium]|nr:metallophosphoesterase [Thermoanaerobaculia bacterium]
MHPLLRSLVLCALLLPVPALSAAPQRVVAIGDIHGEYEGFVSILQKAGLIDQRLRWTGGRTTFVQTGDFLDRGTDVRKVMDLLMALERGAYWRRGRTIVLLGNHELMNLTAALHDAHPASYAAFSDRRSERRRRTAYAQYAALHERLSTRYGQAPWPLLPESEWNEQRPLGFIEFQQALGRNGKYGRWLRSKATIAKVDDSVFLHGGISPNARERTMEKINQQVRLEIEAFDRIRDYLVAEKLILPFFTFQEISAVVDLELGRGGEMSEDMRRVLHAFKSIHLWTIYDPEGPLWFRGFGDWNEEEGEGHVTEILQRFGARRFVVGHTILNEGRSIVSRFGNTVFLIDTGMLRNYAKEGRPAALEIIGDRYAAIYENGRVSLNESPQSSGRGAPHRPSPILLASLAQDVPLPATEIVWRGPDDTTLPFRTSAEVAGFLRDARVVKVYRKKLYGVTRPLKILVRNGSVRAHAVFRAHHREEENAYWESGKFTEFLRDTYLSEIAAYQLSLLLGLDTVPPTVPWQMKRQRGALQLFIEKARPGWHPDEVEQPNDPERWAMESDRMLVFDALIGNTDRHESNMLVDSAGKVWWIDHSRSFGRERDLPADRIQRCERRMWESLKALDPGVMAERLAPYMSPRELDALLERHKRLLALIEQRIAERGEGAVLYTIDPGPPLRSVRRAA